MFYPVYHIKIFSFYFFYFPSIPNVIALSILYVKYPNKHNNHNNQQCNIKAIVQIRFQSMLNLEWPDIHTRIWKCNDIWTPNYFATSLILQISLCCCCCCFWQVCWIRGLCISFTSCLFPIEGEVKNLRTGGVQKFEDWGRGGYRVF